jgi:hypothetical protein
LKPNQLSLKSSSILLLNENLKNDITAGLVSLKNGKILENLIDTNLESLDERVKAETRAIELERKNTEKKMKKLNDLAYLFNTRMF